MCAVQISHCICVTTANINFYFTIKQAMLQIVSKDWKKVKNVMIRQWANSTIRQWANVQKS